MRGQVWSTDFVISAVIFLLALALVVFAWNYSSLRISQQNELVPAESTLIMVSDALIRTPGIPQDWNITSVTSIGLASDENVLDTDKLDMFINMSYEYSKSILGLERYHYYFRLLHLNGSVIQNQYGQNLTAGQYPNGSVLTVPIQRHVLYNSTIAKLDFMLWL